MSLYDWVILLLLSQDFLFGRQSVTVGNLQEPRVNTRFIICPVTVVLRVLMAVLLVSDLKGQ